MLKNRDIKPLPSEEYRFVVPEIQKFSLDNGLKVYLVERHHLPVIRINLMSGCGSILDPSGKKGLSNLFSMSIDEGAGNYDALQLSNEFDLLGSDFDVQCTNDTVYFLSRTLKENLERTTDLFSTVVNRPHFNEKNFLKEKSKILTRIRQIKDNPDEIASNAFEYLIFSGKHPYAFPVSGIEKDINSIIVDDVKNFYSDHPAPSISHFIFSGDINRKEAQLLAEKYFAGLNKKSVKIPDSQSPPDNSPGIYFIDKPGSVQSEIRAGHITEKRDLNNYFPRLLLNLALGGQFSSRINLNLRENKGYTYGAFSNFNFLRQAGYFYVSTSVGVENTFKALSEIKKELNKIRDGVTPAELLFAKTSLMRKFPSNFETNGQIASSISRMILYDLPDDHFSKYIRNIGNIAVEDVNKAAENYIFPEKLTVLIVGSRDEILRQFKDSEEIIELDMEGYPVK